MLTKSSYEFIQRLVKKKNGLYLDDSKVYLAERRLERLAKMRGFETLDAWISRLQAFHVHDDLDQVAEAMLTHETYFFRDFQVYKMLDDLLPEHFRQYSGERYRIWSAGCASGQEAYSIQMLLDSKNKYQNQPDLEILATDVSPRIIEKAEAGLYTHFEAQRGMPVEKLIRFFDQSDHGWAIKSDVKRNVRFNVHNLLEPFPEGLFHMILIRNVLIYFTLAEKKRIIEEISRKLAPGGILILGGSESIYGISDRFQNLKLCVYRVKGAAKNDPIPSLEPEREVAPVEQAPPGQYSHQQMEDQLEKLRKLSWPGSKS